MAVLIKIRLHLPVLNQASNVIKKSNLFLTFGWVAYNRMYFFLSGRWAYTWHKFLLLVTKKTVVFKLWYKSDSKIVR